MDLFRRCLNWARQRLVGPQRIINKAGKLLEKEEAISADHPVYSLQKTYQDDLIQIGIVYGFNLVLFRPVFTLKIHWRGTLVFEANQWQALHFQRGPWVRYIQQKASGL